MNRRELVKLVTEALLAAYRENEVLAPPDIVDAILPGLQVELTDAYNDGFSDGFDAANEMGCFDHSHIDGAH